MKLPIIRHCLWNSLQEHQGNVKFAVKLWITWRITTSTITPVDMSARCVCARSLGQITWSNTWSGNMWTFHFWTWWEILLSHLFMHHMGWYKVTVKSAEFINLNRTFCTLWKNVCYMYVSGNGCNQNYIWQFS